MEVRCGHCWIPGLGAWEGDSTVPQEEHEECVPRLWWLTPACALPDLEAHLPLGFFPRTADLPSVWQLVGSLRLPAQRPLRASTPTPRDFSLGLQDNPGFSAGTGQLCPSHTYWTQTLLWALARLPYWRAQQLLYPLPSLLLSFRLAQSAVCFCLTQDCRHT